MEKEKNARADNLDPISEEPEEVHRIRNDRMAEQEDEKEEEHGRRGTHTKSKDNNKFDDICGGVMSALSLVQEAVQDLLEFKDEMLKQMLPSTLLIQLTLISGKVFRSVSDLGVPVGELVRLVRIYSRPWDKNSAALRNLHESYESKRRQLNIAIQRLQLLDQHSKQVAKEKRVMNWEKLFSKTMTAKGHGRQWKFHIETIKQKARLGQEHLEAYAQGLDEFSETESDEVCSEEEDDDVTKEDPGQETIIGSEAEEQESKAGDEMKDSEDKQHDDAPMIPTSAEDVTGSNERGYQTSQTDTSIKIQHDNLAILPHVIKPTMKDAEIWTHEPEFDTSLFIRIFCPEGLRKPELKCSLSYSGKMFKTSILDDLDNENSKTDKLQGTHERAFGTPGKEDRSNSTSSKRQKRFSEFEIRMSNKVRNGVVLMGETLYGPETLRIAVHQGKFEEILAVASLDMEDIKKMNLETVYFPPPHGDDDAPISRSRTLSLSSASSIDEGSLSGSVDIPIFEDDQSKQVSISVPHEALIKTSTPQLFPLYSLHSGKSDAVHLPCGNVPVMLYWGKHARPLFFNRQCGTYSAHDLVYEMTGIDLTRTTKEELYREMVDEALSVTALTPKLDEETVSKHDYDKMIEHHQQEMSSLQEEYEKRLQNLRESLQATQNENTKNLLYSSVPGTVTPGSQRSENLAPTTHRNTQTSARTQHSPQPASRERVMSDSVRTSATSTVHRPRHQLTQKSRVDKNLPQWGVHLHQNFFERLRLWEEESKRHKQDLNERTLKDIRDSLEKKLAGQHRLSKQEEEIYHSLKDVSLPALFMPFKLGNVYNPRAHQYFHPTGATEARLTQPPSIFQLPPVPKAKLSVMNLFELSKNFHVQGPGWLVEHYTDQGRLMDEDLPHTPAAASVLPSVTISEPGTCSENNVQY